MIHPLLRLIATQPQLLADHAEAYAGLVGEEVGRATAIWKRRAIFSAVALAMGAVSVVLIGVAVMLWGITAPSSMHSPWALIIVPAAPAVIALISFLMAQQDATDAFVDLKQQVAADLSMLREVSA
jgi:hypothetical protein